MDEDFEYLQQIPTKVSVNKKAFVPFTTLRPTGEATFNGRRERPGLSRALDLWTEMVRMDLPLPLRKSHGYVC